MDFVTFWKNAGKSMKNGKYINPMPDWTVMENGRSPEISGGFKRSEKETACHSKTGLLKRFIWSIMEVTFYVTGGKSC